MRTDQITTLDELSEQLMDVFLEEANPDNWSGAGTEARDMKPEVRGSRNWDIKNANQAGALMARALDLRDRLQGIKHPDSGADDAAEADVRRFEKQAKDLLRRVTEKQGGG